MARPSATINTAYCLLLRTDGVCNRSRSLKSYLEGTHTERTLRRRRKELVEKVWISFYGNTTVFNNHKHMIFVSLLFLLHKQSIQLRGIAVGHKRCVTIGLRNSIGMGYNHERSRNITLTTHFLFSTLLPRLEC